MVFVEKQGSLDDAMARNGPPFPDGSTRHLLLYSQSITFFRSFQLFLWLQTVPASYIKKKDTELWLHCAYTTWKVLFAENKQFSMN